MNEERKFLERMATKNGGLLLVDDVLAAAKDKRCVLHKHFEWDDTEAARQYRREQARNLIQKCRVQIATAPDVSIRAFVSLQSDQISGGGYRMTATVLDDAELKAQLLGDIRLTIERWSRKLYLLDSNIVGLIQQLEVSIQDEQNHAEKGRAAA
jgi:hypothetical protein